MALPLKQLTTSAFLLLLPLLTNAHGYWMELSGSGKPSSEVIVKIYFGEYENNLREKGDRLNGMKDFRAYYLDSSGQQQPLTLTQTETCWEARFTPAKAGRYQVVGINDTREVQDWIKYGMGVVRPMEYLRADYLAGNALDAIAPLTDIDVVARPLNGQMVLTAYAKKTPTAKTKLTVLNSQGWEKTLTTGADGTTRFTPSGPGIYIVEAEQMDKTPGQYKDKDYAAVRSKYAMTLRVE
ncbi:nickel transport complex, NikM subunit,transmembrane [Fibrella aestuarina]|nr:nickel transport complex, NikM subunit,transmembrane [Fibrella aestuarina]